MGKTIGLVDNPDGNQRVGIAHGSTVDNTTPVRYTFTTNTELTAAPEGRSRFYLKTVYQNLPTK